jgi:peptidoglycan/LPS O-acetylase OafA/YrhL
MRAWARTDMHEATAALNDAIELHPRAGIGRTVKTNEAPGRFAHNPALDGLRGAAVLVVVLYHTGLLTGGWIGVEIFFVLSGYLITSLLTIEMDRTGGVNLVAFWRRRARRLLPGLFLLLAGVALYVRFISDPIAYRSIRRDIWGALTYSSNWLSIYGGGGYWKQFSAPSPLNHMWSLAVEEQFYLLYPIVAIFILRRSIRRWALPTLAVVALTWQLWMSFHASLDRFYLGSDTRAFGILVGACVALVGSERARQLAIWATPLAVAVLVWAVWRFDGASVSTFHGPFQLVPVATAVVILGGSSIGKGSLVRVLSMRWLTSIGRWSYGIYLIHWPIAEGLRVRYEMSRWPVTLIAVPLSIAIAALSFHTIESPIRRRGLRALRMPLLPAVAAVVFAGVAVGATIVGAKAPVSVADVASAPTPVVVAPTDSTAATMLNSSPVGITARPADRRYRIFLVGDSVGNSLKPPLDALSGALGIQVFSRAAPSCSYDQELTYGSPQFTEDQSCLDIVHNWAADVKSFQPDLVLFVYGSWSGWTYQDQFRTQCDPVMAAHVDDLYAQAVAELGASGAPVYMVAPSYWRVGAIDPNLDVAYDCLRQVMSSFVDQHRTATAFIDAHALACDGANCDATSDGQPVRGDGLHYSGPGAQTIVVDIVQHAIEPPAVGWPNVSPISCC